MNRLLILSRYFIPGFKGGGPIRSIVGLSSILHSHYDIGILTSDRDFGDAKPYESVVRDKWLHNKSLHVRVFYSSRYCFFEELIRSTKKTDAIYVNSFFDPIFSFLPLLVAIIIKREPKIVVAPRGEFSPGALFLKRRKKMVFIKVFRALRLHRIPTWHATTQDESDLIRGLFGNDITVKVAENISIEPRDIAETKTQTEKSESLNLFFLSRICRKKNLKFALEVLLEVRGEVNFSVYGPIEDKQYWEECVRLIDSLPANIKVTYLGEVQHSNIPDIIRRNHLMILPTLGENYGHSIVESLQQGCPVLISDRTPWNDLAVFGAGYAVSLDDKARYVDIIENFVTMNEETYIQLMNRTKKYWEDYSEARKNAGLREYLYLFQ